jgi:hypothetical protein
MSLQRREFIGGLGGAAARGTRAAGRPRRRIGRAHLGRRKRSRGETFVSALTQALADLGWTEWPQRADGGDPSPGGFAACFAAEWAATGGGPCPVRNWRD